MYLIIFCLIIFCKSAIMPFNKSFRIGFLNLKRIKPPKTLKSRRLTLTSIYIPALNLGRRGAESRALFMFWHDVTINLTQFPPNFQGKMQHRPFMRSTQNSLERLSASASPVLPTALLSAHSILPFNTPKAQEFLLLYFR